MPKPRPQTVSPEALRTLSQVESCARSRRSPSELPEILKSLYRDREVRHPDGRTFRLSSEQDELNCAALHQTVRAMQPQNVIEIGMAYAVSTLSILTAMQSNQTGKLISIDPYIGWPTGVEVAKHQIASAGLADRHEHVQDLSQYAMPRLIGSGYRPQLIYIDGHHGFDFAFTDMFFTDRLLAPGGVMVFNDVGWRSVHKVIRFLEKYRDYRELQVGLPLTFQGRNWLMSLARRVQGRSNFDRYFVKNSDWELDGFSEF